MNEKMEVEFMKMDSKLDHLAVAEDESVDEAVPIDTIKERKQQYKKRQ